MKTPIMRHETEDFTVDDLLDLSTNIKTPTSTEWLAVSITRTFTLRETIIEMARNKYHAPKHAIANVSTVDGGVLVELFWLEAQE